MEIHLAVSQPSFNLTEFHNQKKENDISDYWFILQAVENSFKTMHSNYTSKSSYITYKNIL